MKLYELSAQYQAVWNLVEESADLECIEATLQGLEGDIEDKVENIVKLMKSIEADGAAIKAEEERLHSRRKAYENRRESIKKYLEGSLLAAGIEKVKTSLFTAAIQNNPPSLKVTDEEELKKWAKGREAYWIVKEPELSKKALMEDIKAGATIPGAEIQQTRGLRIR